MKVIYSKHIPLAIFFLSLFASCSFFTERNKEEPVARAHGRYLYLSDFHYVIPDGASVEDSILYVRSYIERWVRKNLMLQMAEEQLSAERKDVRKQLEEYRASLLIHRYKDQLLKEKLDTSMDDHKVHEYYSQYKENFHLDEHIVQSIFIIVSKDAPELSRLFKLYKAHDEEELKELEDYVYHFAIQYEYIRDEWIPFNEILERIPLNVADQETLLRNRKFIETQDSLNYYLVNILDYKLAGDMAPVEFVQEDIVDILLNKRRIQFFQDLEKEVFSNASVNDHFTIY